MSNLSMGISPGPRDTRVIAMAGPSDTILKARLSRHRPCRSLAPHCPLSVARFLRRDRGSCLRRPICRPPAGAQKAGRPRDHSRLP